MKPPRAAYPRARLQLKVVGALAILSFAIAACGSMQGTVTLGAVGATVLGARSASSEIEQTYYVGVFDPQDQLPPQVYRLRVHGQGSFIGATRFASGWVPAVVADSLGSNIEYDKDSRGFKITPVGADDKTLSELQTGRRLMMFGPEGFREAPRGHRLAIAMGFNPEAYFNAMNDALGEVAQLNAARTNDGLSRQMFESLVKLNSEGDRLSELRRDVEIGAAQK